jgi:hypothetical protein
MSLRMITDVLKARNIESHCPLCGRTLARFPSDQEHIFAQWLLHHHDLWNLQLNIPNFIGKRYKSVKIQVCVRCNGKTFGQLEQRVAKIIANYDPFGASTALSDDELAIWLGKIFWLLIRKSHAAIDHRSRDLPQPNRIVPDEVLPGTLFLGMIVRAFATGKGFVSCYATDPPIPEFFYDAPYSLYRYRIDMRDPRADTFDFIDHPVTLSAAIRTNNLGVICLFDGGVHRRFRGAAYDYLAAEALHPQQFAELAGRMMYDQLLLQEDANRVTYYWNTELRSVVAKCHMPRNFFPYVSERHDPEILAGIIARLTAQDPSQILRPGGSFVTCLHDSKGRFLRFAVTDAELAAARADPNQIVVGPANAAWRVREWPE